MSAAPPGPHILSSSPQLALVLGFCCQRRWASKGMECCLARDCVVEDVNGGYCPYDHSRFMSVLCMAFLRSGRIPGRFPLRPMMCLVELALFDNSGISNVIGKLGFKVVKGTDTYNAHSKIDPAYKCIIQVLTDSNTYR